MILKSKLFIVVGVVSLIWSCKHEPDPAPVVKEDVRLELDSCSSDTVYFYNDIVPLFVSNCAFSGCHSAVSLSNYNDIINIGDVTPGDTANSYIYEVLVTSNPSNKMPRPPRGPLSQSQIDMVAKWILQGAKENSCNDCNSSEFAFNADVRPIIQSNCVGCHSGSNASGGIKLENYFQIKQQVDNGKLTGSVKHESGFSPMPPSGKMPQCQIDVINNWVNNGAPND